VTGRKGDRNRPGDSLGETCIERAAQSSLRRAGARGGSAQSNVAGVKGAELDGVCYLRTDTEAVEIRQRLEHARDIVVVGGGFIGLELAAAARTLGKSVRVLEVQSRLMPRVVSPVLSDFYRDVHTSQGVEISLGVALSEIVGHQGKVSEDCPQRWLRLSGRSGAGWYWRCSEYRTGSGCGLSVSNGILVDKRLRTEDESIYAIGDCANHPNPFARGHVRIESVQNAVDQAKCVAAAILGRSENYRAVPWFWTDQFDIKLQMAGLSGGCGQVVTRGELESRKFSLFYFRDGRLAAVDSVNRPGDHLAGRKLIGAGSRITPEQAADPSVDLKALS
jgi:3-phenylpropionate/trans-cinnamate dioxygenase ferredoxin reductase subunit